ncbi:hypothetical protein HMPREF9447_05084 [Bacteroides oleiciplenus YIT 12058]|uniref:Uncharacterized protein n=1 Tax=Bacteroides oleiciplenus YIT 12058 TaxID=742727 RepID=K9EEP2_9BACE|nr:hypothetical protein HMPREF9447_05084 [Bacteroides oleiciplenus YIT 12058]
MHKRKELMVECKLAFILLILHFYLVENFVPQLRAQQFRYGGWTARSWSPDSPQLRDEVFN